MATTYAYLVDPNKQYMTKSGTINVNGTLRVYDAATDDIVITYKDFNGTENEASIKLDNNGRAIVIADSARAYRLEVYDRYGSLQWTVSPLWCLAAGGGVNISRTEIISTDGSIDIDKVTVGSTTTFDIGLAPNDSDEFLEWITCSEEDCGSAWYPVYQSGTMETEAGQGVKVHEGHLYHFTNSFTVDPNGSGTNYDTFRVTMYCGDEIVDVRDFDIDSSLNDAVLCEFSRDVVPTEDTHVYFKLTIPSTCEVSAEVQCHRIYSGINAVPDTCATKQWVQETFDYNMAEKISYSALEYNGNGDISGISGSAIAGGLDSAAVSSIASSYAESAISSISGWSGDFSSISSKIDWSSSGVFQPSGDYQTAGDYAYNSAVSSKVDQSAFEQCCDEVHSSLDEKLDKSASSEFQPSGEYVYESAYSSFSSEVTNNISSISSTVSGLTGQYIEQSASSMFQPSGNYASASDLSAYVPFSGIEGEGGRVTGISGSAIKAHEYTGINPVTVDNTADTISVEHRTLCVDSTMTAYTTGDSAVIGVNVAGLDISSKMDASASSLFYPMDNPSGFVTGVDLTPYQLTADMSAYQLSGDYAYNSSVSSKADASSLSSYQPTSAMSAYATESWTSGEISAKLDVTASSLFLTSLPADLAYTSDVASAVSGKLDASASSGFYPMTGNPSGFLTAHQSLAGLATEEYVDSAVSSKLDATAYDSAEFYTTSNPSGFVDSAYVESAVSGKQDSLTFAYNEDSAISSINGSALAGGGGAQVVTSITTGGYGVREINGMVINASHMVLGAEAAYNTSNIVKLGNSDYGAGVFLTGNFGSAYYKVNELQLNRNGTGFIGFNIGGAGSQITATSYAGGKFSAGGKDGARSYYTAFNASASASIEVTGDTAMINISDTGYTSTIYPSSIPYWNGKMDSAEMSAYVAKSAYDDLYSAFTALSGVISQYSAYFSSISAKVDNSAIGVIE